MEVVWKVGEKLEWESNEEQWAGIRRVERENREVELNVVRQQSKEGVGIEIRQIEWRHRLA